MRDLDFESPRTISYYYPNDEVIFVPDFQRDYLEIIFVEDNKGVLKKIKRETNKWRMNEYYRELWNVDERTFSNLPSHFDKKKYLAKNMLRYTKERVWDRAEKQKNVLRVVQPEGQVQLNRSYRLALKAKFFRGHLTGELKNSFINQLALELQFFHKPNIWKSSARKKVVRLLAEESIGDNRYSSKLEYSISDENWNWIARRSLKEIAPGLFIGLRVEQGALDPSDKQFNQTGELGYFLAF